jgi:hypothetical protein
LRLGIVDKDYSKHAHVEIWTGFMLIRTREAFLIGFMQAACNSLKIYVLKNLGLPTYFFFSEALWTHLARDTVGGDILNSSRSPNPRPGGCFMEQ